MKDIELLRTVYKKIDDRYINTKDCFYETNNKDFHLMVVAECLILAETKLMIAEVIAETIESELNKKG